MSAFALPHSLQLAPSHLTPVRRNRQYPRFDLGPCYRYSFPQSQGLDGSSTGGRGSSWWPPCPPQHRLLLSAQPPWHSQQRPSVRGPSSQTQVLCHCQLWALERGAVVCLCLVNVHEGDHGSHLTLMLLPYAVASSQVWRFLTSPHTLLQCPHCESGLQWFSTLTFTILGQACSSGHTTCCEGQQWQMGPMCLGHLLWSGSLVPKLHPSWLCVGDRWRAVSRVGRAGHSSLLEAGRS